MTSYMTSYMIDSRPMICLPWMRMHPMSFQRVSNFCLIMQQRSSKVPQNFDSLVGTGSSELGIRYPTLQAIFGWKTTRRRIQVHAYHWGYHIRHHIHYMISYMISYYDIIYDIIYALVFIHKTGGT